MQTENSTPQMFSQLICPKYNTLCSTAPFDLSYYDTMFFNIELADPMLYIIRAVEDFYEAATDIISVYSSLNDIRDTLISQKMLAMQSCTNLSNSAQDQLDIIFKLCSSQIKNTINNLSSEELNYFRGVEYELGMNYKSLQPAILQIVLDNSLTTTLNQAEPDIFTHEKACEVMGILDQHIEAITPDLINIGNNYESTVNEYRTFKENIATYYPELLPILTELYVLDEYL